MQAVYVERIKALKQRAASVPQEATVSGYHSDSTATLRLRRKHGRSGASCLEEKWISYPARTGTCGLSTDCTRQHCCKVQEHVVGVKRFEPANVSASGGKYGELGGLEGT